ncbi:MAG: hypothetical protein AB7H97_02190, partial [Pseudobdellovibrionaceae bacterium]
MESFGLRTLISQVTLLAVSIFLTAVAWPAPDMSKVPAEMRKLPPAVLEWWIYEIYHPSQEADLRYISVINENNQDPQYRPEAKTVFDLTGYWLPEEILEKFQSEVPSELKKLTQRINLRTGKPERLFFIHPESLDFYPEIV